MVKNKKALTLLLVFLAFFNSPAYPKDKRIKYLPASQNIQTVSKDYPTSPSKKVGEISCSVYLGAFTCSDLFTLGKKCNDCVDLKGECPDCCLTTTSPKKIRCSENDTSDNYVCTKAPFEIDNCAQTECGIGTTGTGGSRSSDDTTYCDTLVCSGGSVDSTTSPYGLQRRGCPDADSDELAPSGCSGCDVTGTGKDRVWTCPKTASCTSSSSPSFQTCSEASGPPRCDGLGSYYDVKYVWDSTTSCLTTQSCNNQCNPTCTPATPSCSSTLSSCADTTCSATQNCPIPCTPPCWDQLVCPPPPPCGKPPCPPPPPCFKVKVCGSCTPTPCTATAICTTTPYIQSHVYSLNSTFKSCIDTCTTYADDYEECRDRVECCEQAVCGTGYDDSCNDASCTERLAVSPECYNSTAGDCARINDTAFECLEVYGASCFKEIDSDVHYDFVGQTGESYNVIWQINTTPLSDAAKDSNARFFTMIKVVDPASGVTVYRGNQHQKSLNAAFSIYGTTLIPKGTCIPGKRYQIQVHYFMNDDDNTNYEVEIKHMGLTVIRVRE